MKIALDYDKTFTLDPSLWAAFIELAIARGHEIRCVTNRFPDEAITDMPCTIIYTSREAKGRFYPADVWIDDNPHRIFVRDGMRT